MQRFSVGKCLSRLLLGSLLASALSDAAVPVLTVPGSTTMDPVNLVQTTATAVQTYETLQRIIRDMQPLTSFATETLVVDFAEMQAIFEQMSGLIPFAPEAAAAVFDVLYPDDVEPLCHPLMREDWLKEALNQTRLAHKDSITAQGLIQALLPLIHRVMAVVRQVIATGGNVEGLQTLGQNSSILITEQARMTAILTAFTRATSSREAFDVTDRRITDCIHQVSMFSRARSVPFALGGGLQ